MTAAISALREASDETLEAVALFLAAAWVGADVPAKIREDAGAIVRVLWPPVEPCGECREAGYACPGWRSCGCQDCQLDRVADHERAAAMGGVE